MNVGFGEHLIFIYFIYGLAYFILGVSIYLYPKKNSMLKLAKHLWLIGAFGILHGLNEWIDMFILIQAPFDIGFLNNARFLILPASYLFLILFGVQTLTEFDRKYRRLKVLPVVMPLLWLMFVLISHDRILIGEIMARYLLATSGAALTCLALITHISEMKRADGPVTLGSLKLAAGTILMYGVFSGLVVKQAGFFPASVLNYSLFTEMIGIPVQVLRAGCAVLLTVCMIRVLRVFDMEARKALRESEERYRTLAEAAHDAIFVIDRESRLEYVNHYGAKLFGLSPRDVAGRPHTSLLPGIFGRLRDKLDEVGATRMPAYFEGKASFPTGEFWLGTMLVPLKNESGTVTSVMGISRDITEMKKAGEEHARLVSAVESTVDAVVITDSVFGTIQYVNPAFVQITGYARNEALGRTTHFLDSGRQGESFYDELRKTLERDGVWRGQLMNKKKDGTLYFEDCTLSPVRDASGEIISYVSVKRDVSEKLRLESIAESVDMMNNIGHIFSGVRHEIGNPINSAKMALSVLQHKLEQASKDVIKEYVDLALGQIGRVERLLQSLKNFNLFETSERKDLNIGAFLEDFLHLISHDFKIKGIVFKKELSRDAEWVYADPRVLQQVLINIVANAMDAVAGIDAAEIALSVMKASGTVLIRIADNGCGMTEKQQQDLFKPFYTTKPQGTGLGLVIVKKMLTKMEGEIKVTSQKDKGTIVDIYLPEGRHAAQQ
jgi:PAS domain S-box-containing protein